MAVAELLPLFAAVPLLGAGLSVVTRSRVLDAVLSVGVPLASMVAAIALLVHHQGHPAMAVSVGAFAPGVAIPFVSDTLSALMIAVTSLSTAVAAWFLILTREYRYRFVPALTLMTSAGVNGALLTGDLFNLFVFVEVMLLPSYALLAVTGSWRRLGIGRMFVIVNLVTSAILVSGVGLVYASAGAVNLAVLQGAAAEDPRVALGVSVVLVALLIKAGVVPAYGWLPRAYPGTSAGVMALFAGLYTKVAVYAVLRIVYVAFAPQHAPYDLATHPLTWVLGVLVVATMLVGALGSLGENRMRGVLAFQMTAGVGHILIGVVLAFPAAVVAGVFYLVHHVITMSGLLTLTGSLELTYGQSRIDRLGGLVRREPVIAVGMSVGLLSLAGLPPTSGLWGKWGLITATAEGGEHGQAVWGWVMMAAVLAASVATLMALQRLWTGAFGGDELTHMRPDVVTGGRGPDVVLPDGVRVARRLTAPGLLMIGLSVALFVGAGALMPIVEQGVAGLFDTTDYVKAVLP